MSGEQIARLLLTLLLAIVNTFSPLVFASQSAVRAGGSGRPFQSLTTAERVDDSLPLETSPVELSAEYRVRHPMQPGSYVTSEYGNRCNVEGVYSGCAMHSGIDFGNGPSAGWLAYPTARGVVSFVGAFNGEYPGCGYYAAIYHPDYDITTIYCHLASPPYVGVGDYVIPTTPIGEVGTTGMSNGIHLHFITARGSYYAGPRFDPREWFAQHGITP